jgi:hypothetical protein
MVAIFLSELHKYNLYTDVKFVCSVLSCKAHEGVQFKVIGYISTIVMGVNVVISFDTSLVTLIKLLIDRRSKKVKQNNFYLNKYCQMSYNFEYVAVGEMLDRFSSTTG